MIPETVVSVLAIVGNLILVSGAVFVFRIRPRQIVNAALALALGGFGIGYLVYYGAELVAPPGASSALLDSLPVTLLQVASSLAAATGFVLLVLLFPAPLRREERGLVVLPALVAAGFAVALVAMNLSGPTFQAVRTPFESFAAHAALLGGAVESGSRWLLVLLAAFRFRSAPAGSPARAKLALMGVAFALLVALGSGAWTVELARGPSRLARAAFAAASMFAGLAAAGVWLAASLRPAPDARLARNVALTLLSLMLVAMVADGPLRGAAGPAVSVNMVYRIVLAVSYSAAAAILACAILRHQLLGLDVKLRFAISKTTVAAVFVAVFFVASEAAQQFFGERFESNYLGIVAAGALVFAIAPLSRLADRVAEKAVPVAEAPAAPLAATDAHERYRLLLRRVLRAGQVTRDEEMALAHAASGMGIAAHDALRLRHEVEDERG